MRRNTLLGRPILLLLSLLLAFGSVPALAQVASPEATPTLIETVVAEATPPPSDESPATAVTDVAAPTMEAASPSASPAASPVAAEAGAVDLDVLFIGAHPDDEAWALSTYGQWNEDYGVRVGVITITRGEGGGNAVGTEEGPALGLLREGEERRAVGTAGIENIYNLDKVDFYYNVSAELTAETWDYDQTLEKVVRVVRATKPEVIVTMNPAPTPGNHGHHQLAARLAVNAYEVAGDATAFPGQIEDEGLDAWRVSRIFRSGFTGEAQNGPQCADTIMPADPSAIVFGVWAGTESAVNGETWAQLERMGQREYASQGWAGFPDAPEDPNEIGCDLFTLIDSRTPFDSTDQTAISPLEGAVFQAEGGLPLGTELYITTDAFDVAPGQSFQATVHARMVDGSSDATVELTAPDGWEVGEGQMAGADGEMTWTYDVTLPSDAAVDQRVQLSATLTAGGASGSTAQIVAVQAPVTGTLDPLQEVAYFREWVAEVGVPQLDNLIFPVFSMGSGESSRGDGQPENNGDQAASGTVELQLPDGFAAEPATADFTDLAAGGTDTVTFTVTNADGTLATSNEGGEEGNYPFSIVTTSGDSSSTQEAGINLVPTTVVPRADTAPQVDGVISEGEYSGDTLDLSRIWEGQDLESPEDASGTAYITYDDSGIYIAVNVVDDTLGTVLPVNDAKRHWRTDSVEIAIDPLGTAGNTSATFKVGLFPTTQEGDPAGYRDADANQGPIEQTAPGMEIASTVNEPYTGYVMEVMIPYDALPADIDPDNATMNIFIYDSDTEDLTGQTRLGWSTWGGVQGDPYRWGIIHFDGFTPPADARTVPEEPNMPLDAAQSANSPQSIRQSANDGVGLGGHPLVPAGEGVSVEGVTVADGTLTIGMTAATAGDVYVAYVVDGTVVQEVQQTVDAGDVEITLEDAGEGELLISFVDGQGRVQAIDETVSP